VTVGALIAWAVGAATTALVLDVDAAIAVLIGAVLIVSGPTVVVPLLRVVRPREPVGSILRWEGIIIDPIGAAIAIVALDAVIEDRSALRIVIRVLTTAGTGVAAGAVAAVVILEALRRHMIADHLEIPATFAALVGAYASANGLRPEAGLIAVTVLGLAFANQRGAPASHIAQFNAHLGTSILGMLFVVLGARVDLADIGDNLPASLAISAALIFLARPVSVLVSTLGTRADWRSRVFLMTLAPRGVVAGAIASLFAIELEHHGLDPGPLVPVTFTVVVITVALASTTAAFTARRLHVAQPTPNGVALIGGGGFAVDFADALNRLHVPTLHIGLDGDHAEAATARGQLIFTGRVDTEQLHETVAAVGIKSAIALSGAEHLDRYSIERLTETLDTADIYGLADPDHAEEPGTAHPTTPRQLLDDSITAQHLTELVSNGATVRIVRPSTHPRSGWLTICRVDAAGIVTFDKNPAMTVDSDWLVQFGPGLTPQANQ
jgi:NhaP-type Na+/H+ or K+/H+ antiporter